VTRIEIVKKAFAEAIKEEELPRTLFAVLLMAFLFSKTGLNPAWGVLAGSLPGYVQGFFKAYRKWYRQLERDVPAPAAVPKQSESVIPAPAPVPKQSESVIPAPAAVPKQSESVIPAPARPRRHFPFRRLIFICLGFLAAAWLLFEAYVWFIHDR
jgi:hypothetical protein